MAAPVTISGRVEIPKEILDIAKAGLFKRSEWRRVFQYVERGAMGEGGILQQNLSRPEVQRPLAPSTLQRKRREGLPATALVGKRGRIQKALTYPTSTLRSRQVIMRKKGGVTFRIGFNPKKFPTKTSGDSFTRILQRGRLKSATTKGGKTLDRKTAVARIKAKEAKDIASVERMPGRPVLSYFSGNETKLTPALLKGVYQVLKEKGLAE